MKNKRYYILQNRSIYIIKYIFLTPVQVNKGRTIIGESEPCPRYAHMLVYDAANKVHFMFGGTFCLLSFSPN